MLIVNKECQLKRCIFTLSQKEEKRIINKLLTSKEANQRWERRYIKRKKKKEVLLKNGYHAKSLQKSRVLL